MSSTAFATRRALLGLSPTSSTRTRAAAAATHKSGAGAGTSIFSDSFESPAPEGASLAVRVLTKIGYGPRPGDVAAFNALAADDDARLAAYVEQQLNPALDDSACQQRITARGYTTLNKTTAQLWNDHVRDRQNLGLNDYPQRYFPCAETECAKLLRAVYSRRQLYEVMVDFWHNHFNVLGWDFSIAPMFVQYDRDVIRPQTFGNFRQMLEEVAKSPAMLQYLDNKSSKGTGFNENFARELCELHTLGVENYYGLASAGTIPRYTDGPDAGLPKGYSDFYIYEAARCFTGWSMRDDNWEFPDTPEYDTGEFLYWVNWHDRASKNFLARDFGDLIEPDGAALSDGRSVLDRLCQHPGTASHICRKICQRLIADNPPDALVQSAAAIWRQHWQSSDQIARVLRHILNSSAFRDTWGEKVKRPWEVFVHALRATGAEIEPAPYASWTPYGNMNSYLQQTGNRPFYWPTPDGFPDVGTKWTSVSSLAQSWRLLSRLMELRGPSSGPYLCDVVAQTNSALPENARSAAVIVDYWIGRIHGYPIAAARRAEVIDFLRQNSPADEPLITTTDSWSSGNLSRHYTQSRLRSAVSLLLITPEFHQR